MEICVTFAIFYIGIFYIKEIKAETTTEKLITTTETPTTYNESDIITSSTTVFPETTETMISTTEKLSTTNKTPTYTKKITTSTTVLPETTETTIKITSTTETPTSTDKITTSTTVLPLTTQQLTSTTDKSSTTKEITSSTEKITTSTKTITSTLVETTTPTQEITTSTEKITSNENALTTIHFVVQITKSDQNEGAITALGTITGVSLIANVILSILLFKSCRRISGDNTCNTMQMYANENILPIDQTEMYTVLGNKEDSGAYQTLNRRNEVVYSNTNTCM